MKKATATVIYKNNMIYNLTVNHKNAIIPLVRYDLLENPVVIEKFGFDMEA